MEVATISEGRSAEDFGRRDTGSEWRTTDSTSVPPGAKFLALGNSLERPTFISFLGVYLFLCDLNPRNTSEELNTNASHIFVHLVIDCLSS